MLDQVNLSRLSHGVRAAAMMRRCWNEALRPPARGSPSASALSTSRSCAASS